MQKNESIYSQDAEAIVRYLNEEFTSNYVFLVLVGGSEHKKKLEYPQYTLRILPPAPIKFSDGNGITSYRLKSTYELFKKFLEEITKGLSYGEIEKKYKPQIDEEFAKSKAIERRFQLTKKHWNSIKRSIIIDKGRGMTPADFIFRDKDNVMVAEAKMSSKEQEIKDQIKAYFQDWDGESMPTLDRIRHKIDELENLQVRERVIKLLPERPKGLLNATK